MALGRHHRSISTRRILSGDRAIPISGPLCQNREVVPMKLSPSQYITKSSQSTTFHFVSHMERMGYRIGIRNLEVSAASKRSAGPLHVR